MSAEARAALIASPKTVFQNEAVMHSDLLDDELHGGTHTDLIALLYWLVFNKGWSIEFTMIRTGHHIDGPRGHNPGGLAADCWLLQSNTSGDYMPASDPRFQQFLRDIADSPYYFQTGLVGDGADSPCNIAAAGPEAFEDDGGAHVHIGAHA